MVGCPLCFGCHFVLGPWFVQTMFARYHLVRVNVTSPAGNALGGWWLQLWPSFVAAASCQFPCGFRVERWHTPLDSPSPVQFGRVCLFASMLSVNGSRDVWLGWPSPGLRPFYLCVFSLLFIVCRFQLFRRCSVLHSGVLGKAMLIPGSSGDDSVPRCVAAAGCGRGQKSFFCFSCIFMPMPRN